MISRSMVLASLVLAVACAPTPRPETALPTPSAETPDVGGRDVSGLEAAIFDSIAAQAGEMHQLTAGLERQSEHIDAAVRTHYGDLLRGRPLPNGARAIWFLGDSTGTVLATGIRPTLPRTVGFDAIPSLVPDLGTRRYQGFTLTGAGRTGRAADVTVLWVELVASP